MTNFKDTVCHACHKEVKASEGVYEFIPMYSRGRMKSNGVTWCKSCYNTSDNSGDEDRCCGDRAYEDRCNDICNGRY